MTIIRCTTSDTPILYAVLWEGSDSLPSLDAISGFQDCPHTVSGNDLHVRYPGEYGKVAEPGKHYVLRGTTGQFFIVTKEEFESTYTPIGDTPWTEQKIENALGSGKHPVTYEQARNLAVRILAHCEFSMGIAGRNYAKLEVQLRGCQEAGIGLAEVITAWEDVPPGVEIRAGNGARWIVCDGGDVVIQYTDIGARAPLPAGWRIQRLVEKDTP